jgi:hypothetical protein
MLIRFDADLSSLVCVGSGTIANQSSVAVGQGAQANGSGSIAIGQSAGANGFNSISLGNGTQSSFNGTTCIGAGATDGADHVIVLGSGQHVGIGTNAPTSNLEVVGDALFLSPAIPVTHLTLLPYSLASSYIGYGSNFVEFGYSKTTAQSAYLNGRCGLSNRYTIL